MNNSISLILPLYNEEDNVKDVVSSILDFFIGKTSIFEIILVNDGSTDRTPAIIEKLSKDNEHVRTIHHPTNRGYGATLVSGFRAARYETVVFMDGDGQYDISDIEKLLAYIDDYDIVTGYRLKRQDPWYRIMLGRIYTRLIGFLFGLGLEDINCGFKVFKKSIMGKLNLSSTRGFIYAEILVKAKKRGCSIKEVAITHFSRAKGKQSGASLKTITKTFEELCKLFVEELHN